MAIDPSVKIDIAAEFTGKKAFDKASKSTSGLEKSVKNLAKTFGLAFSATAVINFAKSSAKAFIEDDNAARSLSVTIKNLGLEFGNNAVVVNDFINNLEKQTGVLDDELRPAMDRLLRATNSVSKSQELLNLSLDIAAGTGKTVTQVSQSLQKAYLGQNAAIGRLGVGISKAELATGDFADIQEKLTKLFAGQSAAAANSYAGQLAKLQVAANNAKETIGKGLVDALKLLASDTSIDDLNEGLEKTSQYVADIILGIGVFIQKLKDIPVAGKAFQLPLDAYVQAIPVIGAYISILADLGKEQRKLAGLSTIPISPYYLNKQAEAAAKAAAQAQADAAAQLKAEKNAAAAKIAADKKAAANKAKLDKAAAVFDLQKIQIAAALKGKITEEEKTRLLLMQAILDEDADKAEALAKKLEQILEKNIEIAKALAVISATADPFSTWAGSLSQALIQLSKFGKTMADVPGLVPGVNYNPNQNADRNYDLKVAAVTAATAAAASTNNPYSNLDMTTAGGGITFNPGQNRDRNYDSGFGQAAPITIIVEGNVLDGDDFTEKVNDALLNANRQGLPRTAAGFLVDAG
jgi:hypothetical protein